MNYQKLNNITGWAVFAISLFVYSSTVEATASFWDCGEFIAVARHLQTPHPPGAPIFSLLGRMFSLFSGDGWTGFSYSTDAAFWVNMMSVVSGAFTVLFLFWSVTMLGRKLLKVEGEGSFPDQLAILGAGFVAALACTFCDSIWFSAVEAEVYAISLFFTSFVFWAMLKRETKPEGAEQDRWMILIAYMVGLSIGVHLLNLVTIPALALIFYFGRYKATWKGGLFTIGVSAIILLIILSGLPGLTSIAFWFDKLFTNSFGAPFNTGAIFFFLSIVAGLVFGIKYSIDNEIRLLNVSLLCSSFVLIGFLSYSVIVIRSQQNPTIDENNPEDLVNFISYLKREQYGDRPLFNGPQFNTADQATGYIDGTKRYIKDTVNNEYVNYHTSQVREYPEEAKSFLPRMYNPDHKDIYVGLLNQYNDGYWKGGKVSFIDNMKYMLDRQMGRMYFRYFLWNFVGRERQEQYASSLYPTDASNEELPELIRHAARNNFFAIPLIIGLIGMFFQYYKDQENFFVVLTLFLFTGLAIIVYLNAPPLEPRERDYAYSGSYMAFSIWIGLAVISLYQLLNTVISNKMATLSLSLIACLIAPSLMGAVGWDDHDRHKRTFSVGSAKNLLNSCAQNAVLFTAGDNDTFPLWYVQEVEGFRTDVRVCNLSLLNTDWYIDQMKRKAQLSEPLPITIAHDDYIQGRMDYLPFSLGSRKNQARKYYEKGAEGEKPKYISAKDPGYPLDKFITSVRTKSPSIMENFGSDLMPTKIARKFRIPLDSAEIANLDFVPKKFKKNISSSLVFDNKAGYMMKKDLIMLDIINSIAKTGWKRPIYFSTTAGLPGGDNFQGIKANLQQEALAYRLLPVNAGAVMNQEITFRMLTEDFDYGNLIDETITYTDDYDRMVAGTQRVFLALANSYIQSGNKAKAKELMDFYNTKISNKNFPWSRESAGYLDVIYGAYGTEEGDKEFERISKLQLDVITYYVTSGDDSDHRQNHLITSYYSLSRTQQVLQQYKRTDLLDKLSNKMSYIDKNAPWIRQMLYR